MLFIVLLVVSLALYCPVFSLIAWLTPWKGFAVFSVKHRHKPYWAIHLALLDRVGRLEPRQVRRFHQGFVRALHEALSRPIRPIFFRSHLMRPAQVKLACQVLSQTAGWHYRTVGVTLPRWERWLMTIQMLLQEWRWVQVPPNGVMVVVRWVIRQP